MKQMTRICNGSWKESGNPRYTYFAPEEVVSIHPGFVDGCYVVKLSNGEELILDSDQWKDLESKCLANVDTLGEMHMQCSQV